MNNIISNLDKIFESRVRLGIMSVLMVDEWVDFSSLKELLQVTDGNLASHLGALERNDYIEIKKEFINRKPKTSYNTTKKGKNAFKQHLTNLEKLFKIQTK